MLNWYYMVDTEENFDQNMKQERSRSLLEMNGWTKDSITYELSEEIADIQGGTGYRGTHRQGGAMFLGCSFTFGLALDYESLWTTRVATKLGLHQNNFAFPGYSNDACFREANVRLDVIKPEVVFMLAPPNVRFEFLPFVGKRLRVLNPQNLPIPIENISLVLKRSKPFIEEWFAQDENSELNALKNGLGVEMLCMRRGIPFYYIKSMDVPRIPYDNARDTFHPGRKWQEEVANRFLSMIEEQ